jgi:hypothetical protein
MPRLDAYTWRARVAPVLLVISPAFVLMVTTAAAQFKAAFTSASVVALLTLVAAQVGRDGGRELQPALWQKWGGAPTLRLLRFSGGEPAKRVERRHASIEVATGHRLPTAAEEAADPSAADVEYEDALTVLRNLTRDEAEHKLVFAENVNYGFRRNTLGLRPWGIASAVLVLAIAVGVFLLSHKTASDRLAAVGPAGMWAVLSLVFFGFIVSDEWVRLPADAYAERLVGAAEVIARKRDES